MKYLVFLICIEDLSLCLRSILVSGILLECLQYWKSVVKVGFGPKKHRDRKALVDAVRALFCFCLNSELVSDVHPLTTLEKCGQSPELSQTFSVREQYFKITLCHGDATNVRLCPDDVGKDGLSPENVGLDPDKNPVKVPKRLEEGSWNKHRDTKGLFHAPYTRSNGFSVLALILGPTERQAVDQDRLLMCGDI